MDVRGATCKGHWIEAGSEMTAGSLEQLIAFGIDRAGVFLISLCRAVVEQLRDIAARCPGIRAGTVQ